MRCVSRVSNFGEVKSVGWGMRSVSRGSEVGEVRSVRRGSEIGKSGE